MLGLQHRRFDLEESPRRQALANRPHHLDTHTCHGLRLRSDDEVDISLANARLLTHGLVCHRQGPQGLGRHEPLISQHREFAPLGGDDFAADKDMVA